MILDRKILHKLNEIGIALSKERNIPALLEKILVNSKELTDADGGTIYTVTQEKTLHFEISLSDSLNMHVGGTSDIPVPFPDLPLFLADGSYNDNLMVTYAVNYKKTINIKDAYHEQGFDFSGTRRFDATTGYRTKAVLTIPIKNHEDEVIAILQLINPNHNKGFSVDDEQLAESLASQAGVALTNQILITNLRHLFESLIHVVAEAIDEKSPSTGNHSKRVPIIALLLAKAVSNNQEAPFKNIRFSDDELYELEVAAFLHDCGKITTPVHIVEKQNKLEAIFDRIELVNARFEILAEKNKATCLQKQVRWIQENYPQAFDSGKEIFALLEKERDANTAQIKKDSEFVRHCNVSKENMTEESLQQLQHIAQINCSDNCPMLTPNELENLSITEGNLTHTEREIIKQHVVVTYRMLSRLKFPKELKNVPEIAASHHERMDGKGYPRGLTREQMSIPARILAIADVFEALSAPDRPYKKMLPLSKVFHIMKQLAVTGHLDPDLVDLFLKEKAYLPYAFQYLAPEQIDIIN